MDIGRCREGWVTRREKARIPKESGPSNSSGVSTQSPTPGPKRRCGRALCALVVSSCTRLGGYGSLPVSGPADQQSAPWLAGEAPLPRSQTFQGHRRLADCSRTGNPFGGAVLREHLLGCWRVVADDVRPG